MVVSGGVLCICQACCCCCYDSSHVQRCWRGVQCHVNDVLMYRGNGALLTYLQPREVYNGLMHFNTNLSVQCRRDWVTILNFGPIIGQYPCRKTFSSRRVLEAETRFSSICLPSECKQMARISAVTVLRSHAAFLRGVMSKTVFIT